jgi:hypothetical protein
MGQVVRDRERSERDVVPPLTRRELLLELFCPAGWHAWEPTMPVERLPPELIRQFCEWVP